MLDIDNLMPPTQEDASNSRKPCFDGLNVGDHMCSFHRTKKEYIDAVSKFIIEGIENKQKTIFLNPPQFQDEIWKDLESLGYSIDTFTSNKQVEIYLQHETYLKDGYFNPQHVHQFLAEKVQNAISEGFSATRIAGMGSQVTTHTDEKTWVDYERSVRYSDLKLFRCMAVCHYFIDNLTGSLLNAILEAHPLCQIGNDILMNSNYLPVDIQDEADPQRAEFEFRIQQMYNQKHR